MSGIAIPGPLGFGGAPLGNMYDAVDEDTAEAALVAAWESGVRHFDTAPVYGTGLGEHRFGKVLRRYPRESFVLATKVGRLMRAGRNRTGKRMSLQGPSSGEAAIFKGGLPFEVEVDYGYDAALRSIEDSLQRLGMSRIDIVYVHDLGADHLGAAWEEQFEVAMTGSFRALSELRDQGVIGAWGLGNNVVEPCIRALERSDPDVIQVSGRYSLLDQVALDRLFPLSAERGVPVVVGGPYNSGLLAGGPHYDYHLASPDMVARRDRIAEVCSRHGVDVRSAALQFCATHPVVVSIIPGSKSPGKVWQNAALMTTKVPTEVWQALRANGVIREDAPVPA
ncbi:Pyridoxal 4-dehydrogenase [Methylobacterium brachiatum]|nr:Pyridoxal 4-dehydrogenase [Methylobacterium brachiatum]